jgi:ribonuclease G
VQDITKLNLVEITRKKARQNLSAVLYTTCPMCQGTGYVQSPETIGIEVRKRLRHMLMGVKGNRDVQLTVHPLIAEYMRGKAIKDMQNEFNCDIKVVPDATLQFEAFSILAD